MHIYEAIYYFLLKPKTAIKKNISFEYSILIYLLTSLSVAVSIIYILDNRSNMLYLFILTLGIASYMTISNIAKIAIINLTISVFFKNNDKNNIKNFINNCFGISGIFIFILPVTLIFGKSASIYFIQAAVFFILQLYYIILMYNNIKYSFNIKNPFKAFLVLITPIICGYLIYVSLAILIFGVFINYI